MPVEKRNGCVLGFGSSAPISLVSMSLEMDHTAGDREQERARAAQGGQRLRHRHQLAAIPIALGIHCAPLRFSPSDHCLSGGLDPESFKKLRQRGAQDRMSWHEVHTRMGPVLGLGGVIENDIGALAQMLLELR